MKQVNRICFHLVWFTILFIFLLNGNAYSQFCVESPSDIIAWWPLDEPSGKIAEDIVGDKIGAYTNNPLPSNGIVDGALRFNGVSYLAVPDSDLWAFGSDDFTVELWANFDRPGGGSISHPGDIFIGNDEGPGTRRKWFFALGGGVLNFHINGPGIGAKFFPRAPFSPVVGQWYHIAVTRRGNLYTIYLNGVPRATAVNSDTIPNANAPLTIGQAENLGFMNGLLDEISIYHRALFQEEIQAIFDAGSAGKCKKIRIRPDKGGDTGNVTVRISGGVFEDGAVVKLMKIGEPELVGGAVKVEQEGMVVNAIFDLTDKAHGSWDVVVTNPYLPSFILPEGFTIEEGRAAQVWADVMGLPVMRPGRPQTYYLLYGNRGNVDAIGALIVLRGIPQGSSVTADFNFVTVPSPDSGSSAPAAPVLTSDIVSIMPLHIRAIPAGFVDSLPFKLTVPVSEPFRLNASILEVTP